MHNSGSTHITAARRLQLCHCQLVCELVVFLPNVDCLCAVAALVAPCLHDDVNITYVCWSPYIEMMPDNDDMYVRYTRFLQLLCIIQMSLWLWYA